MSKPIKKTPQETILDYRSRALICRQQAALHPEANWRWLSEAERWEHLAVRPADPGSDNKAAAVQRPTAA